LGGLISKPTADDIGMWSRDNLRDIAERRGEFVALPDRVNHALTAFERFRGHTEEELDEPELERLEAAFLELPATDIEPDMVRKVP